MLKNNGISSTNDNKYSKPRPENITPTCLIITYSNSTTIDATLIALHNRKASIHYTIDETGWQDQYVNDASDQAFYAGKSSWRGSSKVNEFALGVMLIHSVTESEEPFPEVQIEKLINFLEDTKTRHPNLDLKNDLVGLCEIAARHTAPGKSFPWKKLAEHGFGQFIETTAEQRENQLLTPDSSQEEISQLQTRLQDYGYDIKVDGIYDDETEASTNNWIIKFNTRYVPDQKLSHIWTEASDHCLTEILKNRLTLKEQATSIVSRSALFNAPNEVTTQSIEQENIEAQTHITSLSR